MGKAIEEQSPWVNENVTTIDDSLLDSGIEEVKYVEYPTESITKTGGVKIPENSNLKQIFKLLLFIIIAVLIAYLIGYFFKNGGFPSSESFRGIVKKSEISKLNSSDYKLNELDDEYYEITTDNKDVINNPVVQKDSYFELKSAPETNTVRPASTCSGMEDWDKRALGNNKLVSDYMNKNKKSATVVIIDTGIRTSDSTLKGNIDTANSTNIAEPKEKIDDKNGHGTEVASVIYRYVPTSKMIIVKVTKGDSKKVSYIDTIKSVNYAIQKKPDVINISFGGGDVKKIDALQKSLNRASSMGIMVVVSGGSVRDEMNNTFPAGYTGVISVGSFDEQKRMSPFSSLMLDLYFPGECIVSQNKKMVSGNSYSTAIVSSTILLIKMYVGTLSGTEAYIKEIKSSSTGTDPLLVLNIPKLIKISEIDNEYKKSLDGIKKDLNKADALLEKFKEDITKDPSQTNYKKSLDLVKLKLTKSQSDINFKLSRLNNLYLKNGIITGKENSIIVDVNRTLMVMGEFLKGDRLVLGVTQEKKLKQTLGVDSCIENTRNIICGKGAGSIGEGCVNRLAGGKNLACGMFVPIISSGAQLPATGNGKYVTILNNQENLPIAIMQGDNIISKNNKQLGKVVLEKLPKKVAGEAGGNVKFIVDTNGTLSVKVTDINNKNNEVSSRIENLLSADSYYQMLGSSTKTIEKIMEIQLIIRMTVEKM